MNTRETPRAAQPTGICDLEFMRGRSPSKAGDAAAADLRERPPCGVRAGAGRRFLELRSCTTWCDSQTQQSHNADESDSIRMDGGGSLLIDVYGKNRRCFPPEICSESGSDQEVVENIKVEPLGLGFVF